MAVYTSTIAQKARRKPIDSVKLDYAGDGTPRGVVQHSQTVYEFTIEHPYVVDADKDTILAFYDTNKDLTFTFGWIPDGLNYDLRFMGEPEIEYINATYWKVTTKATGTKQ